MSEESPEVASIAAPLPPNEVERLEALRRYNILDTPPEESFDRITALAARLFDVPIALVSLVDEYRTWFKSSYGLDVRETRRESTICSYAVLSDEILVIPDTREDPRFACMPSTFSKPGILFYAGAPLIVQNSFNLGTLCLVDSKPRSELTAAQRATFTDLAAIVVDELELRLAASQVAQMDAALREVSQGLSAATGEAFFSSLVQHLSKALNVDCAYISLLVGGDGETLRTIAVWARGQIVDNLEYSLRHTPCENVIELKKLCCYPRKVQAQFPQAYLLGEMEIESYMAIPFFDSTGSVLGILGVMDRKPLENIHLAESLLTIFATRVAGELERQQAEVERAQLLVQEQKARAEVEVQRTYLHSLLVQAPASISITKGTKGSELVYEFANPLYHQLVGKQELIGKSIGELFPELEGQAIYEILDGAIATGIPFVGKEFPIKLDRRGDGTIDEGFFNFVYQPKYGLNGKIDGVMSFAFEVTDLVLSRQQAEVLAEDLSRQQKALRESEERYRALVIATSQAIWTTNAEGLVIDDIPDWRSLTGQSQEEFKGWGWLNAIHPEDRERTAQVWIRAIETKSLYKIEHRLRTRDGKYRSFYARGVPVFAEDGSIREWVGAHTDISDRKRAEEAQDFLTKASAILASSLDYESTLRSVASLAVPFFADFCVVDILAENQSLHRLTVAHQDLEKEQLLWELNRRYPDHLDDAEGLGKILRIGEAQINASISDDRLVAIARDPEHLRLLRELGLRSSIVAPLCAHGRLLGAIVFVTAESGRRYRKTDLVLAEDLGRRAANAIDNALLYREAKRSQRAAELAATRTTRLQAVTAALSASQTQTQVADAIALHGMAALGASSALVALLTKSGTELEIVRAVGEEQPIHDSWRSFSLDTPVPLAEAVRTGKPVWAESTEERIARYPHLAQMYAQCNYSGWISIPFVVEGQTVGGMSFSFSQVPQLDEDDRAFILALAQQSAQALDRARLYEAQRTARSAAEAANRVKDEFLAVLSHELRSPLNPILGWAKLLRTRSFDEATTNRALETIERNAQLQTRLIEDLLDISRIMQGKISLNVASVNLKSIIEAAIETMHLAAIAKSISIQSILDPSVGPVSGDPSRLQQVVWNLISNAIKFTKPGGRVEIRLEAIDSMAQIQVKDTGAGIAADFLPHVFEYFRQADGSIVRAHGGLGLGLAIVRHLVEMHGGTVRAESPGIGRGATFTVNLPQIEVQPQPDETTVPFDNALQLNGVRILVVDDDPDTLALHAFMLAQYGAEVIEVTSAKEALKVLTRLSPDVLVSDLGMPNQDGYALIRKVRALESEKDRRIPAIAVTAYAREEDSRQALAAGFQMHISKPIDAVELLKAIANLKGGEGGRGENENIRM